VTNHVTSVGLDVHARSVAAAAFNLYTGEVVERSFGPEAGPIAEWVLSFESPKAVYESGPTGFALCRELRALGVDCVVGAVSKMQKPAADRRLKNDRRDAAFLARLLATHNVVEVPLPDADVEAARDLSRALDDARENVQRARQRLSKFLLRRGHVFDERDGAGRPRGAWTRAFWKWVEGVDLGDPTAAKVLDHYVRDVRREEAAKAALEREVAAAASSDRWRAVVDALSCIKGVDTVTAFCLAAEAGCFSRFRSAPAYASWVGLVPSEHSSGGKVARGGITKAGNAASRRCLVEAAWHFASCSPEPKAAREGVGGAVRARCARCTARLAARHRALRAQGKRPCVANAAVARELACWVWEIGCRAEGTLA
jgi:transposase